MKEVQTAGSSMAAALVNGFGMSAAAAETFVAVLGPAAIAIAALAATVIVIDSIVVSFAEATKKAEESRQAYEKTKSEIDSLNNELQTTQNRIDELKSKGSLTLVEQAELQRLETTNALLERQITLREQMARYEGAQAASDAHDVVTNQGFYWNTAGNYGGEQKWYDYLVGGQGAANEHIDVIEYVYRAQQKVNEATAEYESIVDKNSAEAQSAYQSMLYWQNEVATYQSQIDTQYSSMYGYDVYSEDIARIEALYDYIQFGDDERYKRQKQIDDILSRPTLKQSVEDAKALASAMNGISANELQTFFPELEFAARMAGISAEEMANTINSAADTINIDEVTKQLEDAYVAAHEVTDAGDQVASMVRNNLSKEWQDFVSHLSVNDLKLLYDIMNEFGDVTNSWTIEDWQAALDNAKMAAAETSDYVSALSDKYISLSDAINASNDAISALNDAMNENNDAGWDSRVSGMSKMLEMFEGGLIGSESNLWDIAEAMGAPMEMIESHNADALWGWVEAKNAWFSGDDYSGTDAFLTDLQELVDLHPEVAALFNEFKYADGELTFDIDNANLAELAEWLEIDEGALYDLIMRAAQFHEIDLQTPEDVISFMQNIANEAGTTEEKLTALNMALEQALDGTDLDVAAIETGTFDASAQALDESTQAVIDAYNNARDVLSQGIDVGGADADTTIEITIDTDNGPATIAIDATKTQLEELVGADWEAILNGNTDDANAQITAIYDLLNGLPQDTKATVLDNTGTARANVLALRSYIASIQSKTVTITVNTRNVQSNAAGTKYAKPGTSLLGDEYSPSGTPKPELVVSNGNAYLAGVNGPVLGHLNKGDVVYTADETKKILSSGAYVGIPAFASGTSKYKTYSKSSGTSSESSSYSSSSRSSAASVSSSATTSYTSSDEDAETVDWIETAIKRIEDAINNLKEIASSAYKTVKEKLSATYEEIDLVNKELEIQEAAYSRYLRAANNVGLSESLKAKVRTGAIDLSEYSSDTAELIQEYQKWYDKSIECSYAIDTLHESLSSLYTDIFDNIGTEFDNQLELLEHEESLWEEALEDYHSHSLKDIKTYYGEMRKISNKSIDLLIKKYDEMSGAMQKALDTGVIKEGDQAWYDMKNTLAEIVEDIMSMHQEIVSMFEDAYAQIQSLYTARQNLLQTSATGYANETNRYRNVSSADRFGSAAKLTTNANLQVSNKERELAALREELENSGLDRLSVEFMEYQNKINELVNEIQSLKNDSAAIYEDLFNDTSGDLDRIIDTYTNNAEDIQAKLDTYTDVESEDFNSAYNNLRTNQRALVEDLETNLNKLISIRDQAVDSGKIEEGSIAYIEMSQKIREYEIELQNAQLAVTSLYSAQFDQVAAAYENMAALQSEAASVATLRAEYEALLAVMSSGVSSGAVAEGSEAWYSMQLKLNNVQSTIASTTSSMASAAASAADDARQNAWDKFDFIEERIGDLTAEAEFLLDLLENNDLFSDNGKMTGAGLASVALHSYIYETYMQLARDYAAEAEEISRQLANNPSDGELAKRREELLKLQRESILSAQDEKDAIVDLVKDGIDLELDSLKDLVDAYEDSLDSAKALYEYQRKITDQTSKIAQLQKQLSAYSGDTSEETRSRIQKIQVELAEAQQDLADTEYEQRLSDQKDILDNLYDEYETTLNERLDNVDLLISEMSETISDSSNEIKGAILEAAEKAEYTISGPMSSLVSFGTSLGTVLDSIRELAEKVIISSGSSSGGGGYTPSVVPANQISIEQQRIDAATSYLKEFVEQGSLIKDQMDEVLTTLGEANEESVHNTEQLILQWVENGNLIETQGNAIFAAIHQGMDEYQTLAEMLAEKQEELAAIEAQNRIEAAERVMEEFANQGLLNEERMAEIMATLSEGQDDSFDNAVEMIAQLVRNGEVDEETAIAIADALGISAEELSAQIEALEAAESEATAAMSQAAEGVEGAIGNATNSIVGAIGSGASAIAAAVGSGMSALGGAIDTVASGLNSTNATVSGIQSEIGSLWSAISSLGSALSDLEGYDTGGVVRYTGLAKLDGTPSKPEIVLNQSDSQNFLKLKDILATMAAQPLSLLNGGGGTVPIASRVLDLSSIAASVVNGATPQTGINSTIGDINISIDHVENYDDLCYKMQHDTRFEQMIQDMTIGMGTPVAKFRHRFK